MSKSGIKYVPVLDAVKWLVDVNERGMRAHSRKPEVLPLLRSLEGSYQISHIFVSPASTVPGTWSTGRFSWIHKWSIHLSLYLYILPWCFRKDPLMFKKPDFDFLSFPVSYLFLSGECFPLPQLKPARLFCPWALPGKNTEADCHSLLQGIFPTQGSNWVSCIAGRFFTIWATRKALTIGY